MFQIQRLPTTGPHPHTTRIKLPSVCLFRVPSKVALEGCIAGPAEYRAADGAPGGDDDVDAAVGVGVAFSSAVVVGLRC